MTLAASDMIVSRLCEPTADCEVKHSDEYVAVNDERVADAEAAGCPDAPTT